MIPKVQKAAPVRTQKILVIDDEEDIRTIVEGVLTQNRYLVTSTEDNQHGLALFQEALQQNDPYQLLIMDLTIPGEMPSKDAIKKFKEMDPRVRAIVSSGYSNDPIMANFEDYGFDGVLAKPYRLTDLVKTVKDTIES
jgi:DNA-binding NtrC family response regulator